MCSGPYKVLTIICVCWIMPAATRESPASLVAGFFSHMVATNARGAEKPLSLSTSPLALRQQARALRGMDSHRHQFWTGCIVADIKMLTTPSSRNISVSRTSLTWCDQRFVLPCSVAVDCGLLSTALWFSEKWICMGISRESSF